MPPIAVNIELNSDCLGSIEGRMISVCKENIGSTVCRQSG